MKKPLGARVDGREASRMMADGGVRTPDRGTPGSAPPSNSSPRAKLAECAAHGPGATAGTMVRPPRPLREDGEGARLRRGGSPLSRGVEREVVGGDGGAASVVVRPRGCGREGRGRSRALARGACRRRSGSGIELEGEVVAERAGKAEIAVASGREEVPQSPQRREGGTAAVLSSRSARVVRPFRQGHSHAPAVPLRAKPGGAEGGGAGPAGAAHRRARLRAVEVTVRPRASPPEAGSTMAKSHRV